jgi:hypothetical protein
MTRPRVLLPIAVLALSLPLSVGAQEAGPTRDWRGVARIAKWVLAGATLALGAHAYAEHHTAERLHSRLRDRCDTSPESCTVVDGRYSDAESEALHQRAVRHDRQARTGIVAGQITLLGGVALFLYDLRGDRGPDNIPYPAPRRSAQRAPGRHDRTLILGVRVPL